MTRASICLACICAFSLGGRLDHAQEEAGPDLPTVPVSAKIVGVSMPRALDELRSKNVRLTVAGELQDVKVVLVVKDRPLSEVMARLAQVYGADWRPITTPKGHGHELRRRDDVQAWVKRWRETRRESERLARKFQAETIRRYVKEALAALDRPLSRDDHGREVPPPDVGQLPLARFVKQLPVGVRDRVIEHMAAISAVRSGGDVAPAFPPVLVPFRELGKEQQQLLRDWITGGPGNPPRNQLYAQRLDRLADTIVEIGSQEGIAIEVFLHPPAPDNQYGGFAAGARASAEKMEEVLHHEIFRRLGRRPTPAGALLGASLTPEGTVEPSVSLKDRDLAARGVERVPTGSLAREFLPALTEALGLNLIADCHTRSKRLPPGAESGRVSQVLEAAARKFQLVVRQDVGYLLGRNTYWPDRDDEGTRWPYPERWIAMKKQRRGLTLDDMTTLGQLTDPQLEGLGAYPDEGVNFRHELDVARKRRWAWALFGSLSPQQRKKAQALEGLPVAQLRPPQRTFLIRAVGAPGLPADVRLSVYSWDRTLPDEERPFGGLRLMVPGASNPLWSFVLPPPFRR